MWLSSERGGHVVRRGSARSFAGEYPVTGLLMQICFVTATTCYYVRSCFNNGRGG